MLCHFPIGIGKFLQLVLFSKFSLTIEKWPIKFEYFKNGTTSAGHGKVLNIAAAVNPMINSISPYYTHLGFRNCTSLLSVADY